MNTTGYALQVSRDLGSVDANGTNLLRFRNANSLYSQELYLKFNNSKDIKWSGGSGGGGMTWDMGTRGYVWSIGGTERLRVDGNTLKVGTSSTLKAEINNSVSGHQFISQCSDNNNGFEVYQQHGSTTTRNTFAVYANTGGSNSKNLQYAVRGDGLVLQPGQPGIYLDALDWTSSNKYMHNGYQFWQTGSNWNNSTGTWTCPVAGKYFVAADAQDIIRTLSLEHLLNMQTLSLAKQ